MQLTSVSTVLGWPWPNWVSANANAQFGVINNQQPLSPNHHPQHLTPPPHITTVPNSHGCSQLPSTTYNHGTRPPMAMWQCHITSSNDHQDWQPQTMNNTHKWIQTTLLLTNDSQHLWTNTGDNKPRWDSLPPPHPFLWHRIQVPHHWWRHGNQMTNDDVIIVIVRRPWWVPPIPCSSQPTLLRHWMTMDWRCGTTMMWLGSDDDTAQWHDDTAQWHDEEDKAQQRHDQTCDDDNEVTQPNHDTTMTHAMTTRQHSPMMTQPGHTREDNDEGPGPSTNGDEGPGKPFPSPSSFSFPSAFPSHHPPSL